MFTLIVAVKFPQKHFIETIRDNNNYNNCEFHRRNKRQQQERSFK